MKILKLLESNKKLLKPQFFNLDVLKRQYCFNEDQRTTVDVLNQPGRGPLMINTYSSHGFRLNNGLFAVGPVILFPSTVISWNVANDEDIHEESLSIFSKIEPKFDIVLVGLAGKVSESGEHMNRIQKIFHRLKINCEVMNTERACPTYNFLNVEGRNMAAALIPPLKVDISEDDLHAELNRFKKQMKDDFLIGTDFKPEKPRDYEKEDKELRGFIENIGKSKDDKEGKK
ncbi:NADH dehydrogenase [ubiquinone] 1 alpha subcomplex assembly factor 3 [Nilaparvata lugens]|uniref:NADH dehydrogenase [ubiquinone] 1 alpha subcomplex assembly factor 3 n=1 Tax=Nilaparvata lugens TaxID=108931 RepID=UPI00193E18AF|nr:NADH dehydrogenase [ubiquinone] 1 alpha subcomplex assembly factor 3 [Nilaparvata lugens]